MVQPLITYVGTYNCRDVEKANCTTPPGIFQQTWRKGRKYLMRLINTSTESIFIFTIDNHMLQIIGSDFVPIKPYYADSVLVGIGQRYHIVVEARPSDELLPIEDQNYWIRAVVASGCGSIDQNNETVGVIRYDSKSTKTPTTTRYQFNTSCSDEPYQSLVPVVPWNVGKPSNNSKSYSLSEDNEHICPRLTVVVTNDNFAAGLTNYTGTPLPHGNFSRWDLTDFPLWLNFSNPTITNLKNTSWNPEYCIVAEDYKEDDWVYLIITANASVSKQISSRKFFPVSHPVSTSFPSPSPLLTQHPCANYLPSRSTSTATTSSSSPNKPSPSPPPTSPTEHSTTKTLPAATSPSSPAPATSPSPSAPTTPASGSYTAISHGTLRRDSHCRF